MKHARSAWVLLAVALAAGGLSSAAVVRWRRNVIRTRDAETRERVAELLAEGRGAEAWALVRLQPAALQTPAWAELGRQAMTAARDVQALDALYTRDPEALRRDEEASLLLLRGWLAGRMPARYAQLREDWRGREANPARWFLLDADALIRDGRRQAAAELLRGRTFTGVEEGQRLARLALATVSTDPESAWHCLEQARAADSGNADIRSFCAQFLETAGEPAAARVDYVAALLADPKNPLLHDQLAEFYRRQGSLDLAARTWHEALSVAPPLDFLWVKALFWARTIQPPAATWPAPPREGASAAMLGRLLALPPDRFWTAERLSPDESAVARRRPELVWLRALEHVRAGQEAEALTLLEDGPARTRALQPDLHEALGRILRFRLRGMLTDAATPPLPAPAVARRHPFFNELAAPADALAPATAAFLKGPHAPAAACLAAGWRGAALVLWADRPLTVDAPEWYVYALAQALRYNRGPDAALAVLAPVPATPLLDTLAGELLLQKGQRDEGCARLAPQVARPDDIGRRAAWLTAVARMEEGRMDDVRSVLAQQPALAGSAAGREIEARMAIAAGTPEAADAIYRAIRADSVEARTWLARRAVLRRDWDEARTLTRELLALRPDDIALRESLAAIDAADTAD